MTINNIRIKLFSSSWDTICTGSLKNPREQTECQEVDFLWILTEQLGCGHDPAGLASGCDSGSTTAYDFYGVDLNSGVPETNLIRPRIVIILGLFFHSFKHIYAPMCTPACMQTHTPCMYSHADTVIQEKQMRAGRWLRGKALAVQI